MTYNHRVRTGLKQITVFASGRMEIDNYKRSLTLIHLEKTDVPVKDIAFSVESFSSKVKQAALGKEHQRQLTIQGELR
jgi:hypothetical protein